MPRKKVWGKGAGTIGIAKKISRTYSPLGHPSRSGRCFSKKGLVEVPVSINCLKGLIHDVR